MKKSFLVIFLLAGSLIAQQRGNGDRVDSFPNFSERQLLVVTNACRMAPVQYRDLYVGNYQVLLPANYPATGPLYWNRALNRASRAHSLDMAFVCGMQHPSCDGTSWSARIQSFYNNKSGTIGENIATGNQTAMATLKQWILEVNPSTAPVPADKDPGGADGHRKNIMNGNYRELGCGYAKGTRQYIHFWTQDFGGGKPDFANPLVSGCHFFIETGKTSFFVNYYNSSNAAPAQISCVIDGQINTMTLALGAAGKGTYTLTQAKGTACRNYYFSCVKDNTAYRYPEYGMLCTFGEGSCVRDYTPPESLAVAAVRQQLFERGVPGFSIRANSTVAVTGLTPADYPVAVKLYDLCGKQVHSNRCPPGTFVVSLKTWSGKTVTRVITAGR